MAVTHDPKLDDLALMEALRTPAFHFAARRLAMQQRRASERLRQFDVSEEQAAALPGPAGHNLGSKAPSEIALAIQAEMAALRRGKPLGAA